MKNLVLRKIPAGVNEVPFEFGAKVTTPVVQDVSTTIKVNKTNAGGIKLIYDFAVDLDGGQVVSVKSRVVGSVTIGDRMVRMSEAAEFLKKIDGVDTSELGNLFPSIDIDDPEVVVERLNSGFAEMAMEAVDDISKAVGETLGVLEDIYED